VSWTCPFNGNTNVTVYQPGKSKNEGSESRPVAGMGANDSVRQRIQTGLSTVYRRY
jgi:hypothetical protein